MTTKAYAESKTTHAPFQAQVMPAQNALAHKAQYCEAMCRAGVQPRLEIGAVGDPLERKADETARRVMRMSEPPLSSPASERGIGGEGNLLQAKATTPAPTASTPASPQIEADLNSLNHGGAPLDASSRAFFEPRFGQDFSQVRIHTDSNAVQMAEAMGARAFTLGNNIAFGANQYSTNTSAGRELVAHELAHVGQQQSMDGCRAQAKLVQRQSIQDLDDKRRDELFELWNKKNKGEVSGFPAAVCEPFEVFVEKENSIDVSKNICEGIYKEDIKGAIACREGERTICVWGNPDIKDLDAVRLTNECIRQHEEEHLKDPDNVCMYDGWVGVSDTGPGGSKLSIVEIIKASNRSECRADRVHKTCLEKALKECNADTCRIEVNKEMESVLESMNMHCDESDPALKIKKLIDRGKLKRR